MTLILQTILISSSSFFLSIFGTGLVRRYSIRKGILDHANDRSSHVISTPRGGGLALTSVYICISLVLFFLGLVEGKWIGLNVIAGCLGFVGYIDDLKGLGSKVRLLSQLFFSSLFALLFFSWEINLFYILFFVISVLYLTWSTNLFNFMDGIDGISGQQMLFFSFGISTLSLVDYNYSIFFLGVILFFSTLGFLVWNWSPSHIFLGDVGSTFLGFLIAGFCLFNYIDTGAMPYSFLILMTLYNVEATYTLLVRLCRGVKVTEAHRQHPYQILSRYFKDHSHSSMFYFFVNFIFVLPLSVIAHIMPKHGLAAFSFASISWLMYSVFLRGGTDYELAKKSRV